MSGSWILQTTYSKFQKLPDSHLMLVCQTAFNVTKLETCKPANTLCYLPIPLWTYRHRKRDTKTYSSPLTLNGRIMKRKTTTFLCNSIYLVQYKTVLLSLPTTWITISTSGDYLNTVAPSDFSIVVTPWYRGWHYGQEVFFVLQATQSLSQPLNATITVQSCHRQYRNEWLYFCLH